MLDFFASGNFPSLNSRDGMSDISFSFPAVRIGLRDDDLFLVFGVQGIKVV